MSTSGDSSFLKSQPCQQLRLSDSLIGRYSILFKYHLLPMIILFHAGFSSIIFTTSLLFYIRAWFPLALAYCLLSLASCLLPEHMHCPVIQLYYLVEHEGSAGKHVFLDWSGQSDQ